MMIDTKEYKKIGFCLRNLSVIGLICLLGVVPSLLLAQQAKAQQSLAMHDKVQQQDGAVGEELQQVIEVNLVDVSIEQALAEIAEKADLKLMYSKALLPSSKKVTLREKEISLNNALWKVLDGTGLRFALSQNRQLVLLKMQEPDESIEGVQETITGTVTDAQSGETLPGVNILVKGTSTGASTDQNGNFELTVPSLQDTLIFTYIGYQRQEVPINGRTEIGIQLTPEAIMGEEMVVTGYREQERGNVTGSISSVNASEFEDVPVDNISNALSGRLSGVTVTQGGGTPGIQSEIRIRAVGTFNNSEPLYVIDGVVKDKFAFDGLSQSMIESISVLKDGASASIYGSRAANGVVLVTTKRGGTDSGPNLSYNGSIGIQEPTKEPPTMNAHEHATLINDALDYIGARENDPRRYTQDELDYFSENSWDWIDEMWRNPLTTQHSLNVSGGSSNVRYFVAGSYNYSLGSFNNLSYDKLNLRGNIDVDVTDNLTASLDLSTNTRHARQPSWVYGGFWDLSGIYGVLTDRSSMIPPYKNGQLVGNGVEWHPGALFDEEIGGYNNREWNGLDATATLDYKVPFVDGLEVNVKYNRYKRDQYRKQFNMPYEMTIFNTNGANGHIVGDDPVDSETRDDGEFLTNEYNEDFSYQFNAQVNYRRRFRDHTIDAFAVYEQTESDIRWFNGRRDNFVTRTIDQFTAGSSSFEDQRADGAESQSARVSYIGSVSYDYKQTYLLDGSFRYDGSVVFAPGNRWGFFPSGSFGWRISNESFFNSDFFDDLMIRGSIGLLGNDAVGSFQWLQSYELVDGAFFDSQQTGLEAGNIVNRAITWEKSLSYNMGVDSRFWNNRFNLNIDLFFRKTFDILGSAQASIPSTFGATLPDENYQEIHSRGIEVQLEYRNSFGSSTNPINYRIGGNFGYATNEVKKLNEAENIREYQSEVGRPTGGIFGYVATDIIRTQEDLTALPDGYTILGEEPRLGMLNYRDLRGPNSDSPDGRITSDDQEFLADHSEPPINYGLSLGGSWKSLSVGLLFQGMAGYKRMSSGFLQARLQGESASKWNDRWTPDNTDGAYPAARDYGWPPTQYPGSTWFLIDNSFLRLKNVNISYDIPQKLTSSLNAKSIRLYFSGANLFMLYDNFEDLKYDPEINNRGSYPLMTTYTLGLNINL